MLWLERCNRGISVLCVADIILTRKHTIVLRVGD